MSQKQLNRYSVISSVIAGKIPIREAALCLGLSERQVLRLKKGVLQQGPEFLIHKNTGRKPWHTVPEEVKQKIITLKLETEAYKKANFTHFMELLAEHENIYISYGSLYNLLKNAGIKSPKTRRKIKPHRRRLRKSQEGLLVQIDASPFDWFDTGEQLSLHGAIDDATGQVFGLYLAKNECLQGYFETTRRIISNFGIPASVYADRHSIFLSPKASTLSIEDQLEGKVVNDTQFGRAMKELGVTIIPARSPQAKGRVERLWETLQSRLPVEFKIAGISSIDKANQFLATYVSKFNSRFAVKPANPETAFRTHPQDLNLDHILCVKEKRNVDAGGVFSIYNKHFKVVDENSTCVPPNTRVSVLISPTFGVKVQYAGCIYKTLPFVKPKRAKQPAAESSQHKIHIPPQDHYFKYGQDLFPKVTFEDTDRDILLMLQDIFLSKYA